MEGRGTGREGEPRKPAPWPHGGGRPGEQHSCPQKSAPDTEGSRRQAESGSQSRAFHQHRLVFKHPSRQQRSVRRVLAKTQPRRSFPPPPGLSQHFSFFPSVFFWHSFPAPHSRLSHEPIWVGTKPHPVWLVAVHPRWTPRCPSDRTVCVCVCVCVCFQGLGEDYGKRKAPWPGMS